MFSNLVIQKIFMKLLFFAVSLSLLFSCNSNNNNSDIKNVMPDEAAIKAAVDSAYAAISFTNGKPPDTNRIKKYFIPQAQLINFIADTAQILSISDFAKAYKNYIETTHINYFFETEMFGRTDQFGNIAQRISTYKTFINSPDVVSERGVNSFQLIKTPGGWRVSSIIWDVEDKSLPIPQYYLPK